MSWQEHSWGTPVARWLEEDEPYAAPRTNEPPQTVTVTTGSTLPDGATLPYTTTAVPVALGGRATSGYVDFNGGSAVLHGSERVVPQRAFPPLTPQQDAVQQEFLRRLQAAMIAGVADRMPPDLPKAPDVPRMVEAPGRRAIRVRADA